jgi:hypothetical protein
MEAAIEQQTMKKSYLRLLPFCFLLYFICYLDRVNIGFAALTCLPYTRSPPTSARFSTAIY